MNFKKHIGLFFILAGFILLFHVSSYSQIASFQELKKLAADKNEPKPDYTRPLRTAKNELDITVSSGFLFYKTFISSQDKPSCVFTPSCSEYSVEAFKEKGAVGGWLRTFDRLSRCHSFVDHSNYIFDVKKNRFYDPVK